MCHCCGPESMDSENCTKKQGSDVTTDKGDTVESCEVCHRKQDAKLDDSNPRAIPSLSPVASLSSSASSISNFSDISVDANSYQRGGLDECSTDRNREDNFVVRPHENGVDPSKTLLSNENAGSSAFNYDLIKSDKNQIVISGGPESESSNMEDASETSSTNEEFDAHFWLPPEPKDEDDVIDSVAKYDDDDDDEDNEYNDNVKWSESNSLKSFEDVGSAIFKAKEEKKKALEKVMNGKFKTFVGQLLKTVGVEESERAGDSWMNIVTSLSWQAASYIKPGYNKLKAVDPNEYVKIKCIATGSCSQSRVIRGLVFKKHAAHKRMPAKYKHPKILLIEGALGLSSTGLSSFKSMQQEEDIQNRIVDMIEMYHPNVIMVEKAVSRDIQESILAKGMTLVLDMKLHRLERIARCTGSPIISSDSPVPQKLRQCDSFYFEKFLEEHAPVDEGGKRPSKTLMFLEGCPTRRGCSILLKGADSDVLKRVKYVVRCAVGMAYHIMLETSFLLDQRAMFSTIGIREIRNVALPSQQIKTVGSGEVNVCSSMESDVATTLSRVIDITIPNRVNQESPPPVAEENSTFSFDPYNPLIGSGFPSFIGDKILNHDALSVENEVQISRSPPLEYSIDDEPKVPSNGEEILDAEHSHPSLVSTGDILETQISSNEKIPDHEIPILNDDEVQRVGSLKLEGHLDEEPKVLSNDEEVHDIDQPDSFSVGTGNFSDTQNCNNMDDIGPMLDTEGILVLVSTRNASRGSMCEHRHFSRIKFYQNFDVPLGKFLLDDLLNQRLLCKACSDPPEDHIFYYAHHNKQLTIQVRRLPTDKCLSGETEGKLWMWSRCGKCKFHNGSLKSTKRVLISNAARGLSFGKFLELGFSHNSSFGPSFCGHMFHNDFLHFFGFGPMVAMFKYSKVATYSVSLPPQKLDFRSNLTGDCLKKNFEDVHSIGVEIFQDIKKSLKKIGPKFVDVTLNIQGSIKEFSDIEEMLNQERDQFEAELHNAVQNENQDEAVYKFLGLNRVKLVLLIESYVWDQRIHALLSCDVSKTKDKAIDMREGQTHSERDANGIDDVIGLDNGGRSGDKVLDDSSRINIERVISEEIQIGGDNQASGGQIVLSIDESTGRLLHENGLYDMDQGSKSDVTAYSCSHSRSESCPEDGSLMGNQLQKEETVPLTTNATVPALNLSTSQKGRSSSLNAKLTNDKGPIWLPFYEIVNHCMHDIFENFRRDTQPRFGSVLSFPLESMAHRIIADEGSKLHVPLGNYYILTDYENELSSIIACALAKDRLLAGEDIENSFYDDSNENSHILPRLISFASSRFSSTSSLDLYSHASSSMHLEDSSQSSVDGWLGPGDTHREILLGKISGKPKYSIICLYASRFRELRNRWCPSEADYIASLSRCKSWDAKGGKSKSIFAKTLDDRFIIKEIKRAEFDSFVKFAPEYFGYMNQCHERQNQTCLAKILGIYQVVGRQTSGKETRHDLMVMENLSFGRNFTRSYDLKGALHARLNTSGIGSGDVLLDQNFVNDMNSSPLYVSRQSKRLLQRGYWNDTSFLKSIQVMDYSLLVGVDSERQELVCGIIDYLRQYTWDKQLETWVKSSLVPKNLLPTIISPGEYYRRFRKFIDTHFVSVPDDWCFQRSKSCLLCGPGEKLLEHSSSHEPGEYEIHRAHGKSPEESDHEDNSSPYDIPVEETGNLTSA
ncbi:hypothetical protein Leryth_009223 [Lithospermum erythrorhizon]|nr:hypothetical protein Leryth_009223 [Lithospermum erythrorhizon]